VENFYGGRETAELASQATLALVIELDNRICTEMAELSDWAKRSSAVLQLGGTLPYGRLRRLTVGLG